MNRYVLAKAPDGWPEGIPFHLDFGSETVGVGDEFDHEFDNEDDERDNLHSGLLEIVPRTYKVITEDTRVHETAPGGEFDAALTMGEEAHLVGGGFIERVESAAKHTKKKAKEE